MNIICCVDDAPEKVGRSIMGIEIMGTTEDIPELLERCEIETILFAIPTVDDENKRRILSICNKTKCNVRILPDIVQLIANGGKDVLSRVRDVRVEDVLGREQIELTDLTNTLVSGKVVMVTGGGGSIGSELCRQIAACGPKRLIIVDIYENSAYSVQQELKRRYGSALKLDVCIASVRDSKKVDRLFARYQPDVVFHAAAHKHVPLMEDAPEEAVKNNVFGTYNVALSADKYGVGRFVLISTDKAVNPTNVMGATKRLCEMIVQALAQKSKKTKFVAVRFGNNAWFPTARFCRCSKSRSRRVISSPCTPGHRALFYDDPRGGASCSGSRVMGNAEIFSCWIWATLSKFWIWLKTSSSCRASSRTAISKSSSQAFARRKAVRRELLMDEEGLRQTDNKKIFVGAPLKLNKDTFFDHLATLKQIAYSNNSDNLVQALIDLVPTFHHAENNYD